MTGQLPVSGDPVPLNPKATTLSLANDRHQAAFGVALKVPSGTTALEIFVTAVLFCLHI